MFNLDLGEYILENFTSLVGIEYGILISKSINFEDLERHNKIVVSFPEKVIAVNKSFLSGLFGQVIKKTWKIRIL